MDYEVRPTRVGSPKSGRSLLMLAAAGIAVVGIALAAKQPMPTPQVLPVPAPTAAVLVTATARPTSDSGLPAPSFERNTRVLPGHLECKDDVDVTSCVRIATAALRALPANAPAVRAVSVWRSLLCDSSLDCPPRLLQQVVPVGSVVLGYAGGSSWVNVVERPVETESGRVTVHLEVWAVR